MSLRRLFQRKHKAEADRSSLRLGLENDRPPSYTSNVTTAPAHTLPGRDSVRLSDEPGSSLADTLGVEEVSQVVTPNHIYYRIYAEDGALPSKTAVSSGDPFLGRIKFTSVPPPRNAKAVKGSITKVENIKDPESTTLYRTSYSQSPMDNSEKVSILNGTGPGSTPQKPLALVAKLSNSERNALVSGRRGGLANAAEPNSTPSEIRYVYYQLYSDGYEMPSKVANDPEEPSIGRIRADSIPPPHSPTSIKLCISRVEGKPALLHADLFSDTSCDTPLTKGHISFLHNDGPGLSPNEPMAIVQVKTPSIPDGKYFIKNPRNIYWGIVNGAFCFYNVTHAEIAEFSTYKFMQWDISHDTNGNISMKSMFDQSWWVGAKLNRAAMPVPWRLIPADGKSFYLTTDMNRAPQNPQVATQEEKMGSFGSMVTLKKGDQSQMWEFIRV